jgi:hypothetical protein
MYRVPVLTIVCATAIAVSVAFAEPVLSRYRGVTLGDPVQVVIDQLKLTSSDVKVVHERPTLIQRITWRPRRLVSGTIVEPDALGEMVLTFHLGRLASIAVAYEVDRTRGLTNPDLHEVFTNTYGTSILIPTATPTAIAASRAGPEVIGRWDDTETLVLLWREPSTDRIKLTVTSIAAERAVQEAIADGLRLDASEAPARDLARRATEDAALRARDEKARGDNKATFTP